jgi:hypothetical protein
LKHNSKYQQNPRKWFKLSRKGHGCLLLAVLSTVAPLGDQDSSNTVWFACVFYNMGNKFTIEQNTYACDIVELVTGNITCPVHLTQEMLA